MSALNSTAGVNLGEAARSIIAQTTHIKRITDLIPDEIANVNYPHVLFAMYGAQKMIQYATYSCATNKCRSIVTLSSSNLNKQDLKLVENICSYAIAKLGVGLCGEIGYFSKYLLAKQGIHSVIVGMVHDINPKWNHSFLLIGSLENWKRYLQDNKGKDINDFFEQLPGAYIVDPLLRSHGPTQAFRTSHTASYLEKIDLKKIKFEDSEVLSPSLLAEIEKCGDQLVDVTRRNINNEWNDVQSSFIRTILQLHFKCKWKRMKEDPFPVWKHGSETDLGLLKEQLTVLGLPSEIEKRAGEGGTHSLVITTLPVKALI